MEKFTEQFSAAQQSAFTVGVAMLKVCHLTIEQVTTLNLATARAVLEDGAKLSQQLLNAKSAQEALLGLAAQGKPGIEKLVDYYQASQAIGRQSQQALKKVLQKDG